MPINDRNLDAGTKLTAKYKGQEHSVLVLADDKGALAFELDNGTIFKSLSSAGSAVMGGTACNGWRFWSVEGTEPEPKPKKAETAKNGNGKLVRQLKRVPNQRGVAEGQTKWFCSACQASFLAEIGEEPRACPKGHAREVEDEFAPPS